MSAMADDREDLLARQRAADHAVELHLGAASLLLHPRVGHLVLALADRRHGRAVLGRGCELTWLFPGGGAGQHLTAAHLRSRLTALGISATRARNTALIDLAAQLPTSVLADLLGLSYTAADN